MYALTTQWVDWVVVALGVVTLVCYLLMREHQHRRTMQYTPYREWLRDLRRMYRTHR